MKVDEMMAIELDTTHNAHENYSPVHENHPVKIDDSSILIGLFIARFEDRQFTNSIFFFFEKEVIRFLGVERCKIVNFEISSIQSFAPLFQVVVNKLDCNLEDRFSALL